MSRRTWVLALLPLFALAARAAELPEGRHRGILTGIGAPLPGLVLQDPQELEIDGGMLTLEGSFTPQTAETGLLLYFGKPGRRESLKVVTDAKRRFTQRFAVASPESTVDLVAVNAHGEVARQHFRLQAIPVPRRFKLTGHASLGVTWLDYRETSVNPYSAFLLTPRAGATLTLAERWSVGAGGYWQAISFARSAPATSVAFLNFHAWGGYLLPWGGERHETRVKLGGYWLGMWVGDNTLGFDRFGGPQIELEQRLVLDQTQAWVGHLRYAATLIYFTPVFTKRELAAGVQYERCIGARTFMGSLDLSNRVIDVEDAWIAFTTLTLSFGVKL